MWHKSILETIGNTPLVKMNRVQESRKSNYLLKVEYFNPGQSVKDRIAIKMIEDAEKEGKLKPGATIIEGTSGNTGMGLALAAAVKGYRCIFTTTDKQSMEKVNLLRALGAQVKICPTNVDPDDPRSYYSVAKRLSEEIPGSYYPNQYDNLSNTQAHYETTGPEVWEQTDGKITHFVAGMGTGGTVSGVARYLKEKNPDIKIIAVDSVGSIYKTYFDTGRFDKQVIAPYLTEGIGEDIIPKNVDMDLIDDVVQCPDKEAFVTTRSLATREGIFVGGSCGAAVWGAMKYADMNNLDENSVMVILMPDSGSRYVSKIFNDEWMRNNGFLDGGRPLKAVDILRKKPNKKPGIITVQADETLSDAIAIMNTYNVSQIPVMIDEQMVGSLQENRILNKLIEDPGSAKLQLKEVMEGPFPIIPDEWNVDQITKILNSNTGAVVVNMGQGKFNILTRSDLINALSQPSDNNAEVE
ncbi:MAG: pyridoxal-phosphate dependent enzyme [Balneolales bacterium]